MKRLFFGVAFSVSLFVAPLTYADTTPATVYDPITDTLHLWSEIAGVVSAITGDIVSVFNGHDLATSNAIGGAQGQPASAATAAGAFADAEQTTIPATPSPFEPQPAGDTPGVVNNYITNPIQKVIVQQPLTPTNFVTQSELAEQLRALSDTLTAKFTPTTAPAIPDYVAADGNEENPFAAASAIDNLSNVTISNPTISGGSISASSITGTISNLINAASGEVDALTGTTLTYSAAAFTNATTTNFVATNATTTDLAAISFTATGTSTLGAIALTAINCSTFGNGGKLTTDALGNVTCAADQGGSGSTVGGADTNVQFNSGGSFQGASSFTFASSTSLLTITNASTTDFTANYASTTNFVAGNATITNATSTNLFAALANFTTGVISTLSGTQLTYTTASTTNLSNTGTAYFGGTATSSFNSAGQLTLANLASAVLGVNNSGQVVATTSIGTNLLSGTLGVGNGGTGSTTLSGILKGNGAGGIQTAAGGIDYEFPLTFGTGLNRTGNTIANTGILSLGSGYATTSGTSISLSTTTQSFNGLTLGDILAVGSNAITVTPTVSGAISNSGLQNSTISGVSLGGTLANLSVNGTLSGSAYNGSSAQTFGINLENSNWWTAAQNFSSASTSQLTATSTVWFSALPSALLATDQNGKLIATTTISTGLLSANTISGIPLGSNLASLTATNGTLTFSGSYNGNSAQTVGLNLANPNSWTGLQQFGNASTTLGTISTLWLPSISANSLLYGNGSEQVAAASVAYPLQFSGGALSLAFGTTTANTWSQLQSLQSGFLSQASSTVVGNFTNTGNHAIGGTLAVNGTTGTTTIASGQGFTIGGSQFVMQQGSGNVGIGTTSPGSLFSLSGIANFTTATSTFYGNGFNLASGCFAITGTCLSQLSDRYIIPELPPYNAVGNGVTDDRVALQAAINAAEASGKPLLLTRKYAVSSSGAGYALLVNSAITIEGGGAATSTGFGLSGWIFPLSSATSGVSIIEIKPNGTSTANNLSISNIAIGDPSNFYGQYDIYIDTPTGSGFGFATFKNLTLYDTQGHLGIYQYNDGTEVNGGFYTSQIEDNNIQGGIELQNTGSGNLIDHNYIQGGPSGIALYFSQISGGTGVDIRDNTIADNGGAIKIDSGDRVLIEDNNFEIDGSGSGSNGAIIDLNGGSRAVNGAQITGNSIGNYSSSASLIENLRINNASSTYVGQNNWYSGNSTQSSSGYWIVNNGIGTTIAQNQYWPTGVSSTSRYVTDSTGSAAFGGPGQIQKFGADTFMQVVSTSTALDAATHYTDGTNNVYDGLLADAACGVGNWAIYNGGCRLIVNSFGNVGIGTTSPIASLSVGGGTSRTGITIDGSNSGTSGGALFAFYNADIQIGAIGNRSAIFGGAYDNTIDLFSANAIKLSPGGADAMTLNSSGNVGVATLAAGTANSLCFNTSAISGMDTLSTCSSDERLKQNITPLDGSSTLAQLLELNPVSFNWNPQFASSTPTQFGLIAQQLQQVWPNLVSTTSPTTLTPDGTLSINFNGLFGPIIAAIQTLSSELTSLENTITGFAQSITSAVGNFGQVNTSDLCVGSTCVTPAQFQAMVAAAGQANSNGQSNDAATSSNANATATVTPPVIQINGDNPTIIQVGATYGDLGATIEGPQQDLNLGIQTYLNGSPMSPIVIDTSEAATDTIDYVATDQNGLTSTSTRTVIIEAPTPSIAPSDDASSTPATSDDASTTDAATTTTATSTAQ